MHQMVGKGSDPSNLIKDVDYGVGIALPPHPPVIIIQKQTQHHTALQCPLYNQKRELDHRQSPRSVILTLFFSSILKRLTLELALALTPTPTPHHMPSDLKGVMRGRFVRKLKLVQTITNLKKQGLVLQRNKFPFPTPFDDFYKGNKNNLSELVLEDDNHFEEEEEEATVEEKSVPVASTNKIMMACSNEYPNPSLTDFKELCPPGGNHSIILYTTSLRGIRKTFQDCNTIRFLLRSFKIMYDERDVSLHLEFREELWRILGGKAIPPKLFIKGRFIGGADEVVGLHEMGWLRKFLEGTPTNSSDSPCTACANVRFAICSKCSGSCKVFTDNKDQCFVRCSECNENGLVKCPVCC